MKREDVTAIFPEATKDQLDKLMSIAGDDVNKAKGDAKALEKELEETKAALEKAKQAPTPEDLAKVRQEADGYKKELDALKLADGLRVMREKVAGETGVTASLLKGETEEACKEEAAAILAFAKAQTPTGYPAIKDGGSVGANGASKATRDQFADWAKDAFN